MQSRPSKTTDVSVEQDDFTLTVEQMVFMINADAAAEKADEAEDYQFFDELTASPEWKKLFGDMSWDQAYDRYEIMIGRCTDC